MSTYHITGEKHIYSEYTNNIYDDYEIAYEMVDEKGELWAYIYDERLAQVICDLLNEREMQ